MDLKSNLRHLLGMMEKGRRRRLWNRLGQGVMDGVEMGLDFVHFVGPGERVCVVRNVNVRAVVVDAVSNYHLSLFCFRVMTAPPSEGFLGEPAGFPQPKIIGLSLILWAP